MQDFLVLIGIIVAALTFMFFRWSEGNGAQQAAALEPEGQACPRPAGLETETAKQRAFKDTPLQDIAIDDVPGVGKITKERLENHDYISITTGEQLFGFFLYKTRPGGSAPRKGRCNEFKTWLTNDCSVQGKVADVMLEACIQKAEKVCIHAPGRGYGRVLIRKHARAAVGDDDEVGEHGVQDYLSVIESQAMDSKKTELLTAMLRLEMRPLVLKVFSEITMWRGQGENGYFHGAPKDWNLVASALRSTEEVLDSERQADGTVSGSGSGSQCTTQVYNNKAIQDVAILEVPGVGPVTAELLKTRKQITNGEQLFGFFLYVGRDEERFKSWLKDECKVRGQEANRIYEALANTADVICAFG